MLVSEGFFRIFTLVEVGVWVERGEVIVGLFRRKVFGELACIFVFGSVGFVSLLLMVYR